MSVVPTTEIVATPDPPEGAEEAASRPAGDSLRDRIARKRVELQQQRTFELDLPGYEQDLAVRYRPLGYREARAIGHRHEKLKDETERELRGAADTLITACQTLIDKQTGADLDIKWGAQAARELFGVELPDGATARLALFGIFQGNEMLLMSHFYEWAEESGTLNEEVTEELAGESAARR